MERILSVLDIPDFEVIVGMIQGRVNLTSDKRLRLLLNGLAQDPNNLETRRELHTLIEREIRYLGSADVAYAVRKVTKHTAGAGVVFREIILDVFRKLKLKPPTTICTDEELLENLVERHISARVHKLTVDEQRLLLEHAGAPSDKVDAYLLSYGRRFAVPAMINVVGAGVTQRFVANIVIDAMATYLGRSAAKTLFSYVASRFPIWAEWLGPIAWGLTGLWTAYDVQGPASRKTVPITLYLALCSRRVSQGDA